MKYIRTKDGIYEVVEDRKDGMWAVVKEHKPDNYNFKMSLRKITKIADTIEELCDWFVVIRDSEYILASYSDMKNWFDSSREKYGAIWTDKGLIYVAKMNDKGVLELL